MKQLNDIKEEVREDWTKFRSSAFNGIYNTDDLLDYNCDTGKGVLRNFNCVLGEGGTSSKCDVFEALFGSGQVLSYLIKGL